MSIRQWLTPPPWFRWLLIVYVAGMAWFALYRVVFLVTLRPLSASASFGEIATAFLIGFRFDQIPTLTVLALPALLLPWTSRWLHRLQLPITIYLASMFTAITFLLSADIRYYRHVESHLNFLALEYLGEGSLAWNLMVSDSWWWPTIAVCLITLIAGGLLVNRSYRRFLLERPSNNPVSTTLVYFVVVMVFFALGIRGRTGLSPLDWGAAYFSENHFVNSLALNGPYTLLRTLFEKNLDPRLSYYSDSTVFPFMPAEDAMDDVRRMLKRSNEDWGAPQSSIERIVHQPPSTRGFRPNIVLVIMESWSGRHTGVLGGEPALTPYFDSMCTHGTLFTKFYAAGTRTGYGLGAILCGFPALPGRSISNRYAARHPFRALSEILCERGYYNAFMYGGDLMFDNVEGFFTEKGYHRFIGQKEFPESDLFSKWGVPDHSLFERMVALTDSLPRPFQITALTLSNHEPFDLPDSSVRRYFNDHDSSKQYNAQLYADFALNHLMQQMQQKDVYDSTIFVFTADHGTVYRRKVYMDPRLYHTPLLIIDPTDTTHTGRTIETAGGQTHVIPTLMHVLGDDYRHASWGVDLLTPDTTRSSFAMVNIQGWIGLIGDEFCYAEWVGHRSKLYFVDDVEHGRDRSGEFPDVYQRLRRQCRAYAQMAEQLSMPPRPAQ